MKELNFGIIGFGYFGKYHARVIQRMQGAVLRSVASHSFSPADDEILPPAISRLLDAEELLGDASIDCVVIATPPSTHLELIKAAVRAKKHILIEKPAVINLAELEELDQILIGYDKCFMVGHIYLYNDFIHAIKKIIEEGAIGAVRYVRFRQMGRGPIRTDVDPLLDMGIHHLSIMEYLFGPSAPVAASGMAAAVRPGKTEDFVAASVRYSSGLTAHIEASWFSPEKEKQMVVTGDKGFIVFDDVQKKLTLFNLPYPTDTISEANRSIWLDRIPKEEKIISVEAEDPQKNELEHFAECARSAEVSQTGIDHIARITRVLDFVSKNIIRLQHPA
jgi:predicted dehydrogenase